MSIKNTIFVTLLSLSTSVLALTPDLSPQEGVHRLTTLRILQELKINHYEKRAINDELSARFLENYLNTIDGNRQIFLADEVKTFEKDYQHALDDALKRGNVEPGYVIYNKYRQRLVSILEKEVAELPKTVKSMDFTKKESLIIDRSDVAWPTNLAEVEDIWRKRLKASVLSLKLAGKEDDKIIELLSKRKKNQLNRIKQLNSEDVFQLYLNAFTELYDPHTTYMSPKKAENFDISMRLKLEGIGAMLRTKDEFTKVIRLIHGGPAHKQGDLQPSDRIVGVAQGDGEMVDVVGWRLDEVVELIRGRKGTIVNLEVIPAKAVDDSERKIVRIQRDEVKLEDSAVQKAMLDIKDKEGITRKLGVLDIPTFYHDFEGRRRGDPNYRSTKRDVARQLSELQQEGAEGLIIDLRNNGGGSLLEAMEVTGLFVEPGPSVQTKGSNQEIRTYPTGNTVIQYKGPVVILINRLSASASEIFAGALQDYQRAIIVGTQSFGKGTVQELTKLNHGTLKLTKSKFYRISGDSTQNRGVLPDIAFPQVYDPELVGESALDNAMRWDTIPRARHRLYGDYSRLLPELKLLSQKRTEKDPDFKFLLDKRDYELSLKTNVLSLNKEERLKQREEDKAKRLALTNELRKAKGEPLLEKLEDADDEEDDDEDKEPEDLRAIDTEDPFLIEAGQILLNAKK